MELLYPRDSFTLVNQAGLCISSTGPPPGILYKIYVVQYVDVQHVIRMRMRSKNEEEKYEKTMMRRRG